jgi:tetratricopeptide (TPR) repeat protein
VLSHFVRPVTGRVIFVTVVAREGRAMERAMKRASTTLALLAGVGLLAAPMIAAGMGSGGSGGGGMPGGMSGMSEQYDPAQEYQRGEAALQVGKYRDAEDAFQHVVDSTPRAANTAPPGLSLAMPQMGDGAYVRAVSLINERRWDEALAALDKAETAIGPHPDILTYKGYVWRKKGDWSQAESYYRQALAMNPDHRGATEYYGELKVLEGDVAGAKVMLAKLDAACSYGCAEAEELRLWIDHGGDPAS